MNKNHHKGVFTISLDFELHWGCLETKKLMDEKVQLYFQNTRKAIPQMLNIFQSGEIHVTWASVGMLFCSSVTEWRQHLPQLQPNYEDKEVSTYEWIRKNGFDGENDPCHFAPELIDLISQTPFQEVGTHTFSHYFCWEPGQTAEAFKADLLVAKKMAEDKGLPFLSLVFPRNQYREEYLDICRELGILAVRTNPDVWYWTPVAKSGLWRKIFRTADAYLTFTSPKHVPLDSIDHRSLPLHLPASRLYRPWQPKYSWLNKLKIKRIKQEMTSAAKNAACYHLWWHPHNFGNYPQECLAELKEIVAHYQQLNKQYGFSSMNMRELTDMLINR